VVLVAPLASSAGCVRRFHVTHELLAYMLGVRRGDITDAALALQHAGLIAYRRDDVMVLDRPALERAACACIRERSPDLRCRAGLLAHRAAHAADATRRGDRGSDGRYVRNRTDAPQ